LLFGSTSKISFAGAGLAVMGGSRANLDWMRWHLSKTTIGPDKLNQLRHVRFFQNFAGIQHHMLEHARLLRPKFQAVADVLLRELEGLARWTRPEGGYFVSLDTVPGAAARVVELADQAGVKFTSAGATFPYGQDPNDQNIRIAPTLPDRSEIEQAMQVLCVCVKLATLELVERAGC
jgi:DNA-binding transcriptional MocR family regulator